MLNLSQIAALQQMGICVWQQAELNVSSASAMPADTQPSASRVKAEPDRAQQLAALRSAISSENSGRKNSAQKDAVALNPKSADVALTAQQQADGKSILNDLSLAIAMVLPNHPMPRVRIAPELKVTTDQINLPVAPAALTAADKKQLWQAIARLG